MIHGVFCCQPSLARDAKKEQIRRHKDEGSQWARNPSKLDGTGQLHSIIGSQGMGQNQCHRLLDHRGCQGCMGEAPPIICAKGGDNPVSYCAVHIAHAFLAGQRCDDLGSRNGRNEGDCRPTP